MKVNTITCHDVYNYGASLQAYALQRFVELQGCQYEVIDYKPDYLSRKYQFTSLPKDNPYYNLYRAMGPLGVLLSFYFQRDYLKFWKRKKAFDKFKTTHLHCTSTRYQSNDELHAAPPVADIYITGSDQVWNTDMKNGKDDAFYLSFAPEDKKKMAYAASFGVSSVPESLHAFVKERLMRFDWVSVREHTGVNIVQSLGLDAIQVMDPVFLLTREQWLSLCRKQHKEKYLLLYYLGKRTPEFEHLAKTIAKKRGLKIYSINDSLTVPFADKNINNAGPIEFIEYLSQAEYILGTSFHATAFSLIFNRQFGVYPIQGQNNQSRMKDLLTLFGLENHFLQHNAAIPEDIDYCKLAPIMESHCNGSRNLLIKQLVK